MASLLNPAGLLDLAEQTVAILRPVFKDDEMLMVTVGAVLGFLVGELQVVLVEHLAH